MRLGTWIVQRNTYQIKKQINTCCHNMKGSFTKSPTVFITYTRNIYFIEISNQEIFLYPWGSDSQLNYLILDLLKKSTSKKEFFIKWNKRDTNVDGTQNDRFSEWCIRCTPTRHNPKWHFCFGLSFLARPWGWVTFGSDSVLTRCLTPWINFQCNSFNARKVNI